MYIKFDSLSRYEMPLFTLCNPGCVLKNDGSLSSALYILTDTSDEELVLNFNSTSELNFRITKTFREENNDSKHLSNVYSHIQNRRMIYVDNIGFFVIKSIKETVEDGTRYKDVSAVSCEDEIQQKAIPYIENNTYPLYTYPTSTDADVGILNKVISAIPLWELGHIDDSLLQKYRTFEDVDTSLNCLGFLMDNIQDAYECIVLFDNTHRLINIYDRDTFMSDKQTSIHITNRDVVNSLNITENSDDLYTALSVTGVDDLTINAVNPLGNNVVYNFDYYLSWMSKKLEDTVIDWRTLLSIYTNDEYDGTNFSTPVIAYVVGHRLFSGWLSLNPNDTALIPDTSTNYIIMSKDSPDYGTVWSWNGSRYYPSDSFCSYKKLNQRKYEIAQDISELGADIDLLNLRSELYQKLYNNIVSETMRSKNKITDEKKILVHSDEYDMWYVKPDNRAVGSGTDSSSDEIGSVILLPTIESEITDGRLIVQMHGDSPISGRFCYTKTEENGYIIKFNSLDVSEGNAAMYSYEVATYSDDIDTSSLEEFNEKIVAAGGEPIEYLSDITELLSIVQDRINETKSELTEKESEHGELTEEYNRLNAVSLDIHDQLSLKNFFKEKVVHGSKYFEQSAFVVKNEQAALYSKNFFLDSNTGEVLTPNKHTIYVLNDETQPVVYYDMFVWNGTRYVLFGTDPTEWGILLDFGFIDESKDPYTEHWIQINKGEEFTPTTGDTYVIVGAGEYFGNIYYWTGTKYVPSVEYNDSIYHELTNYIYEGSYSDEYISITESMTQSQRFDQEQTLYERGVEQLRLASIAAREFDVDMESFVFVEEFKSWTDQLVTGCSINVELEENDVAELFLSNITVNYADHDLSLKFSNDCRKYDSKTLFENVLGSISKTANTVSAIKDIITPMSSEIDNMQEAIINSRVLTMKDAIASQNQEVVIDSTGYLGRKKDGDVFDPHQIKMTNQNIVFTNDNWETSDVAIGTIRGANGEVTYGINAKTIIGEAIIGESLSIKDKDGNDAFKVLDDKIVSSISDLDNNTDIRITQIEQNANSISLNVSSISEKINGIDKIRTKSGTFDENGLTIKSDSSSVENNLDNTGMYVKMSVNEASNAYIISGSVEKSSGWLSASDGGSTPLSPNANKTYIIKSQGVFKDRYFVWNSDAGKYEEVYKDILTADISGVKALNLQSRQFLIIGENSRFQDYNITKAGETEHRTGCFFIYQ